MIGYNIRIFLNDMELISSYLISALGNSSSFACGLQRHKKGMVQIKLALPGKLNEALPA